MTEAEWLSRRDFYAMLRYLHFLRCTRRGRPTDPKVRLLACHCCDAIQHLIQFQGTRQAFRTVEAYSRGSIDETELATAVPVAETGLDAAEVAWRATRGEAAILRARAVLWAADAVFRALGGSPGRRSGTLDHNAGATGQVLWAVECALVCEAGTNGAAAGSKLRLRLLWLFDEIFGNPFRPAKCDPAWRTSDVMLLAHGINEERAFDRMPILADALQDAGCDNPDILNHCRDTQLKHVRGCWVVDLVLGKE